MIVGNTMDYAKTPISPDSPMEELIINEDYQENSPPMEAVTRKSNKRATGPITTTPIKSFNRRPTKLARLNTQLVIKPTSEDDDDEDLDFGEKGFLPVRVGQLLGKHYKVVKKLGSGTFGTVWQAVDQRTLKQVALKIGRCGGRYNRLAEAEIAFMDACQGSSNLVELLEDFEVEGQNGSHVVMVAELMGPSLEKILHQSNQTEMAVSRVQKFCKDLLEGIDFMHSQAELVHCDLKPDNIMVTMGQEDPSDIDFYDASCPVSLKIGDFGLASWSTEPVRHIVQTCCYRAPESLLNSEVGTPADMWSFGCIAYEMMTGMRLFGCHHQEGPTKEFLDHIGQISAQLGEINSALFTLTETNEASFELLFGDSETAEADPAEVQLLSSTSLRQQSALSTAESLLFCDFLRKILEIDPARRLTAKEALDHPFLKEIDD